MPPSIDPAIIDAIRLHQAGRLDEAEAAYRQLLAAGHRHPELHHYFGVLLQNRGRSSEAIESLQRAIALNPNEPRFYTNAVPALFALGRLDHAIQACQKAIALKPGYADAYYQMGLAHRMKGEFDSAIACYRRAVESDANHAPAWNALGLRLKDRGEPEEAMGCYEQALKVNPRFADAHNNMGILFKGAGYLDQALASFHAALNLRPDNAETLANVGSVLKDMGNINGALDATRQAMRLKPNPQFGSNLLYTMLFDEQIDPRQLCEAHRQWAAQFAPPADRVEVRDASPDRRLRVGYVSPDFRDHPIGRFMLPLLRNHDHAAFEVCCYSDVMRADAMTRELIRHADVWRETRGLSDDALLRLIREDRIDVLIDLTMHMESNRMPVFARRAAPVQATYLAYAGTTGMPAMDYRLTDALLDPPGEHDSFYTERSIYLKGYWCYLAPSEVAEPGELPAGANGFVTFGSMNNFCKITSSTFSTWVELLKQIPTARMIIHAREGSHRRQMLPRFANAGVEPARIEFAGIQSLREYFDVYRRIDIALDPFPYPGGTTTCDALWMGVPVVTLPGESGISRSGLSILSHVGSTEWVARDSDDYVQIAMRLAADPTTLAHHRRALRDRMLASPLMDAKAFARDFESAIRHMRAQTVT
jgi:protein O-GlcNAc transferase